MSPDIRIKRVYEDPGEEDGARFLVDGMWPRGIKKEDVEVESWLSEVAPSKPLRQWFGHDPARWEEFQRRYAEELDQSGDALAPLLDAAEEGRVTLVYAAKDEEHNNARALARYLERRLGGG